MDDLFLDTIVGQFHLRMALLKMIDKAAKIGVQRGVAVIMVTKSLYMFGNIHVLAVDGKIERRSRGDGDPGTNYFAIAMAKLGVMMSTLLDSGTFKKNLKRGEVSYRGGLYKKVGPYHLFAVFSGGTEDQDVEIAEVGMKYCIDDIE